MHQCALCNPNYGTQYFLCRRLHIQSNSVRYFVCFFSQWYSNPQHRYTASISITTNHFGPHCQILYMYIRDIYLLGVWPLFFFTEYTLLLIVLHGVLWKYFNLLATIFMVSTKCIDPQVLEFVLSNTTCSNKWENCISLDFNFRGISEPRNPRKIEPHD